MLKIALVPADGVGREVVVAAGRLLKELKFQCEYLDAGWDTFQRTGVALPPQTVAALKSGKYAGALFGSVQSPSHKVPGYSSPIVQLRKELSLYANVRPIYAPARDPESVIDMVIYRENTECLYVKREREYVVDGHRVAVAERQISEVASRQIGRMAYRAALERARQRSGLASLTIVHKSNVLSLTDGLFRESVHSAVKDLQLELTSANDPLARQIPSVEVKEQLVDSAVYKMYRPEQRGEFDVVVAPNLYGDILSDAGAALVGSLGVVAGANVGDTFCMAEPVHGSAPDIAIKGLKYQWHELAADKSGLHDEIIARSVANPIATLRSVALLLRHLKHYGDADRVDQAVNAVLMDESLRSQLTRDIGGKGTLKSTLDAIMKRL